MKSCLPARRTQSWLAPALGLIGGVTVGTVDLCASAVQAPVALLLIFGFALGLFGGRWGWCWALLLGACVFFAHALAALLDYRPPYAVEPTHLATFLALIPAMLGYLGGLLLARALRACRATQEV